MTDKNEQIVRLKDTEGLSWGEIGERTGLSAEAARSRYRNQRKRIELQESPGILEAAENLGILDMIKLKGGWLKSKDASLRFDTPNEPDEDNALDEYVERLKRALGALPAARPSTHTPDAPDSVQARYLVADLHGGMAANMAVSGGEYDLDLAEHRLVDATQRLVQQTAPTQTAVIANLGDMFHANDSKKKTFHSGHILDMVKQSFPQIALRVTIAMIQMIETVLSKHEHVIYRGVPGNHDVDQFFWLTIAIMMHYRDNPRVTVEMTEGKLIVDTFGRCMNAYHHGDSTTFQRLVNQISDQYAPDWGKTYWRYLDTGHVHHDTAKEVGGMLCESHRNLAPVDAAAHGFGYWGRQVAKSVVIHNERGEIDRHIASFG